MGCANSREKNENTNKPEVTKQQNIKKGLNSKTKFKKFDFDISGSATDRLKSITKNMNRLRKVKTIKRVEELSQFPPDELETVFVEENSENKETVVSDHTEKIIADDVTGRLIKMLKRPLEEPEKVKIEETVEDEIEETKKPAKTNLSSILLQKVHKSAKELKTQVSNTKQSTEKTEESVRSFNHNNK